MSTGVNGHDIYCGVNYQNLLDAETCHFCARLAKARWSERQDADQEWNRASLMAEDIAYRQGRLDAATEIALLGAPQGLIDVAKGEPK